MKSEPAAGEMTFEPAPVTGYPLFNARVNGHPARFAFDTGGGRAILVSPSLVQSAKLAVDPAAEARLNGSAYPSARIRRLEVEGLGDVVRDESAAVVSLDAFSQVCGERVDGIIGAAALARRSGGSFEVDFPRRRLRLGTRPLGPSNQAIFVPTTPDAQSQGRPFVWIQIGDTRVPAVLDSCEYEAVQLSERVFGESGVALNAAHSSLGSSGFGGAALAARRGRVAEIRVGDVVLHDVEVQVVPSAEPSTAEKGVIGTAVLKHYRIAFDATRNAVSLFGPRELRSPAPGHRAVKAAEGILAR